jgi:hypothetical protein
MRRWSAEERQPEPSGRLRGGASTVAQVIGAAAQEDPGRLTAVLESLPPDVNPVYTTHILLGLTLLTCAPTATRTRDVLLRRHYRDGARWRSAWPDVPFRCTGSGRTWPSVAWRLGPLAPSLAANGRTESASLSASQTTDSSRLGEVTCSARRCLRRVRRHEATPSRSRISALPGARVVHRFGRRCAPQGADVDSCGDRLAAG